MIAFVANCTLGSSQMLVGDVGSLHGLADCGLAKTMLHAGVGAIYGGITTGDATSGAIGGALGESVGGGLGSVLACSAALLAGGDVGQASMVATSAHEYNRRLHENERIELQKLKEGKSEEECKRLDDAAKFMIGAADGVSDSDTLKPGFLSSAELGKYNAEELAQLEATGLFVYTKLDAISDFISSNEEIVSRSMGAIKFSVGVVGMIGSAVGVTSGFGSVVAAGVGTGSTYYAKEGYDQAFGPFEHKEGARVLASFEKPTDSYALEQGKALGTELVITAGGGVVLKGAQVFGSKVAQVVKQEFKHPALPNEIAETFAGGRYTSRVLEKDTILYRAGSSEFEFGSYFSKDKPKGIKQVRIDKALLPVWKSGDGTVDKKSIIDTVYTFKVPEGTIVDSGKISSQGNHFVGGTQQIVIEKKYRSNLQLLKQESLK